jgi:hypothetical protein
MYRNRHVRCMRSCQVLGPVCRFVTLVVSCRHELARSDCELGAEFVRVSYTSFKLQRALHNLMHTEIQELPTIGHAGM